VNSSGEFEGFPVDRGDAQVHTSIPFHRVIVKSFEDSEADALFLIDAPYCPGVVTHHKHSLLAACDINEHVDHGSGGFTLHLTDILREAYSAQRWLTVGAMHSVMLSRTQYDTQ